MHTRRPRNPAIAPLLRNRSLTIATVIFLAATAVAAGLAFAGSTGLEDRRVSIPLLLVILASGVFALLGWATEKARREELAEEHREEREQLAADYARREAEIRERHEAGGDRPRGEGAAGRAGEGTSRDA